MSRTFSPPDASNTSHAPIPLPTLRHANAFGAEKSADSAKRAAPASGVDAREPTLPQAVAADHGREAREDLDLRPTVPAVDEAQASFTFIAASEPAAPPAIVAPFGQADPAP